MLYKNRTFYKIYLKELCIFYILFVRISSFPLIPIFSNHYYLRNKCKRQFEVNYAFVSTIILYKTLIYNLFSRAIISLLMLILNLEDFSLKNILGMY